MFLLITLAITPLRRITRYGQLLDVRRMLGVGAFCYAALHISLYVLDQQFDLVKVASEIVKRIYLIIGFVALSGLTVLAITSTDGMVRRLGGMRWARLHQIVYVIAFLALIHYFQQTKADVSVPTLVAGLFGWLMCYRFAVRRIRGELSSAGLALLSVVVAALTLIVQALGVALVFHVSPLTVIADRVHLLLRRRHRGHAFRDAAKPRRQHRHAQPGLAGARRGAHRRCRQRGLRALRQAAPRARQGRRRRREAGSRGRWSRRIEFPDSGIIRRHSGARISANPESSTYETADSLDSGFRLTRAPE